MQVDKLGMTDGFIKQIGRSLKERTGKDYTTEQVKRILHLYETVSGGLAGPREINRDRMDLQKSEGGKKKRTKEEITQAIYGQFRSQREKTAQAAELLMGEKIDLSAVHLGEINLEQYLQMQSDIVTGVYNPDQFAAYTAQRFMGIFDTERSQIEGELGKFVSTSGREREVLNGYITKNRPSANARMVGGVCVSGDNPNKGEKNMWDQENYFQMVFQDPDTLQCEGLALLHDFEENGEKVLAASLNPSSTYLYSIDEAALFNGIVGQLEIFARDNNMDKILLSQNKAIRTNRTGGKFESAMDARVRQMDEKFSFAEPQVFSFRPNYNLKDMDVIWKKPIQSVSA
jgi:hypothetical protein